MGLEPLFFILWGGQLLAAAVLAWRSAINDHWFGALGIVVGAVIGILPFFLVKGPAAFGPAILIVIGAVVVLAVSYVVTLRWKSLAVVLLVFVIPVVYRISFIARFPPNSSSLLQVLAVLGEMAFLLGPIASALACREIVGLLDRARILKRSA